MKIDEINLHKSAIATPQIPIASKLADKGFSNILDSKLTESKSKAMSVLWPLLYYTPILEMDISKTRNNSIKTECSKFIKQNDNGDFDVEFWDDYISEMNIWLSDVLGDDIQSVRVSHKVWDNIFSISWVRRWSWWFYDKDWNYIPIFSWYKIEILTKKNIEDMHSERAKDDLKISSYLKRLNLWKLPSAEIEMIVRKSIDYKIDPLIVMSFADMAKRHWKESFWINRAWIDKFNEELNMLCRIIQNNEEKYKNIFWIEWSEVWIYTIDFLSFLSTNLNGKIQYYENDNGNKVFIELFKTYNERYWNKIGDLSAISRRNEKFVQSNKEKNTAAWIIWQTSPDDFIKNAQNHIWKPYVWWWWRNNKQVTDCSWLILMTWKDSQVFSWWYDDTAAWISKLTIKKDITKVTRWDLVFIHDTAWKITHVEIATWSIRDWKIPIIDASKSVWSVSSRYQSITSRISVWRPIFYSS